MEKDHTDFIRSNNDQSSESTDRVDHTTTVDGDDATGQAASSPNSTSHLDHDDNTATKDLNSTTFPGEYRATDTEYSTPLDDPAELECFGYIETLLRAANHEDPTPIEDRTAAEERAVEREFDSRILAYAPDTLADAGLPLDADEWSISTGYVQALVLRSARDAGYRDFAAHLDAVAETRHHLDLDGGHSKSALNNRNRTLEDAHQDIIEEAADRALHTAYRAGVPFPKPVWDRYAAKDEPLSPVATGLQDAIENGDIPQQLKDKALNNWADWFLEECMLPTIEFDRTDPQYPVSSLIGLCAHAAIQGESLPDASKTAGRVVGYEPVSSADTVFTSIRGLGEWTIDSMFQDARAEFFDLASNYDVFDESLRLAYDLTDVPRFAPKDDDPWVKGYANPPKGDVDEADADSKWEHGLLSITEPGLYFALGLHPFEMDLTKGTLLDRILRPILIDTSLDVELLMMDRGLYTVDVIDRCRRLVGDNWLLLAPHGYVEDIIATVPDGEAAYIDSADVDKLNDLDEKPNAVVVPLRPRESNTESTHFVFLTDLAEDEVDITDVADIDGKRDDFLTDYQDRNHIEHTIGRNKHDFDIPHNDQVSTEVEYCFLQLSQFFYNCWVLINHARSPEYGYPVGKTEFASPTEVLQAFREVAFEKAAAEMDAR